ncbi:phage major capsid protein [Virgibacillus sp. AGTR]|uniref:phage major capsid protein n=1 Tax=Virgibacillus sp. AGTR TaxID=2812055 RepID=UPI001D16B95F|nr:phage major capsid protein [Virgibacillus sp. AGTR]MCC2249083.1 phage major capsid protein [Virgibacillus sp. AGTR]
MNKKYLKMNLQTFSDKTLYEMKQNMATIGQQLQKVESELAQKAVDPSASMEDIQKMQKSKEDLKARFDVIKEQHDQLEAEQKAKFAAKDSIKNINNPAEQKTKAKASLIRATMRSEPLSEDVYQVLGDDTTTKGDKFLPKTVSNDIIAEPYTKNQLRDISTFTQITNLEIPKINFTLDDDDFIADKETAKELEATGDVVAFTRNKFKVFSGISETVLLGTDANVVNHVERSLQSGVAAKEKKVAFATSPKSGEEHMSFYSTQNGIKKVNGANLYKAIKSAIADLHEDYRENATIVMRYQDYSDIIETLANGNATLYSAQPEQILGKPVVFVDAATDPIVGDYSYSHYNYDIATTQFERDKDVKTGIEQFVVTAWFDHRIKLASAFRIAKVTETP